MPLRYDMPLYRPPSEGRNLIIQATIGCSYNRCTFCSNYWTKTFRVRPLEEVFRDIDVAAAEWPDADRVFLADGDALMLPTDHLHRILDRLASALPQLTRVTSYATPDNVNRKSVEELTGLRESKLTLLYVGIESGHGEVLKRVSKGASPQGIGRAINRAREAGMKVSAMVILGLGGREYSDRHIDATIELVNNAPPTFLSTLQLDLQRAEEPGFLARWGKPFEQLDDMAVLDEMERLVTGLDPAHPVIFRSNHASNTLPLGGTLPKDRAKLLSAISDARSGRGVRPWFLRGG
ncbi:MAG: radical SAM protein [Alphaproteobacteria bacterium]|nr:radical SAM protein [Alphaproteobacteria bacterium]MBF0128507.1 radical SAM protein [Alphaproteobacteria bacterium]